MTKAIIDIAERAVATYLQAFLGLLLAGSAGLTDISALKAAAVAALPAALAVLKGALGTIVGGKPLSAAWLPARWKQP